MAGVAIDFTYRYPFASYVGAFDDAFGLNLSTCGSRQEHSFFFSGRVRQPRALGDISPQYSAHPARLVR